MKLGGNTLKSAKWVTNSENQWKSFDPSSQAAEKSLAILRTSPEQATLNLASGKCLTIDYILPSQVCVDGPQSNDLLRPVFMGCATKNAKVVAISLGSLQRLIALKAVPHSAVPLMINTMSDAMSQGVDIQLRILQTLVSLIPNFPAIHGVLLGDVRQRVLVWL